MWIQLDLDGPLQDLAFENLGLTHIAGDHLVNLAGFEEQAEAGAVHPRVVANTGQVLDARLTERVDEVEWRATQAESADHEAHAVAEKTVEGGRRAGVDLVHAGEYCTRASSPPRQHQSGSPLGGHQR